MSLPALSLKAILDAALRLIDAQGVDALTMRRLAAQLEVGTMSLYSYVPNKDDLLDGVVGTVAGEIGLPPSGLAWQDSARFLLLATLTKEPGRLGNPAVRVCPNRRAVLGDDEVERRVPQWDLSPAASTSGDRSPNSSCNCRAARS